MRKNGDRSHVDAHVCGHFCCYNRAFTSKFPLLLPPRPMWRRPQEEGSGALPSNPIFWDIHSEIDLTWAVVVQPHDPQDFLLENQLVFNKKQQWREALFFWSDFSSEEDDLGTAKLERKSRWFTQKTLTVQLIPIFSSLLKKEKIKPRFLCTKITLTLFFDSSSSTINPYLDTARNFFVATNFNRQN